MPGSDAAWKALRARLSAGGAGHVHVGIVGPEAAQPHPGTEATNAEVGLWHEYGLGVPERSFIRRTFRNSEKIAQYKALQQLLARQVIDGKMTMARAGALIGAWGAAAIQSTITDSDIPPPLAPATIRRKGSSKPLVDTGQLVRSITWVIVP